MHPALQKILDEEDLNTERTHRAILYREHTILNTEYIEEPEIDPEDSGVPIPIEQHFASEQAYQQGMGMAVGNNFSEEPDYDAIAKSIIEG